MKSIRHWLEIMEDSIMIFIEGDFIKFIFKKNQNIKILINISEKRG